MTTCPDCDGSGWITTPVQGDYKRPVTVEVCLRCGGSGLIETQDEED